MKKLSMVSALFLTASLLIPLNGADAATPPNVGSACTKVGTFFDTPNKRFVCNQEGVKKVWRVWNPSSVNKPTVIKKYKAPMPIKLPVSPVGAITFSNILDHIADIPTTSYNNIQEVLKRNKPKKVPTSMFVGPTTKFDIDGGATRIQTILDRDAQLWNGFVQPNFYAMYVYNAEDEPLTEKKFAEDFRAKGYDHSSPETLAGPLRALAGDCQQQIHPGAFKGAITKCTGANSGGYFNSKDSFLHLGQSGTSDLNMRDGVVIGHEYLHSVVGAQWMNSPNCTNPDNFAKGCSPSGMSNHGFSPCWIYEGLPNAAGSAVAEDSLEKYLNFRKGLPYGWGPTTITDYTEASLKDYLVNQSAPSCYLNGELYKLSYSIGALATEALISIAGPQAVMAIYALGAEGQNFQTAFKNVYGISWSDAAVILSKVLAAEYATYGPPPK